MALVALKGTLDKVLRECRLTEDPETLRVFFLWKGLVGEKVADHARPIRVRGGILFVEVDDPLWLTQLKYMKADIVQKIHTNIKAGVLKDMRFFLRRLP
jgi:predicted nucleic acid-binding Zn ribbon protein